MAITGIVRQQTRSVIAAQSFAPKPNVALVELTDVNVTGAENGQGLIYNSVTGKFEANNVTAVVTSVFGGNF